MTSRLLTDDKRIAQFRKLTEVSRALTYAASLDEVLRLTVERAADLIETDRVVLMLANADGLLSVRAAFGIDPAVHERFREPLDEALIPRLQGLLDVGANRFLGVPLVVDGNVIGILAATITPREELDDEREWLLSALADQAAVALEKARLDETATYRERLIGIVSHDLRNPINVILLGATSLVARKDLDKTAMSIATRIQSSAERANRLIRDLLDYTHAHLGGGIPVNLAPEDLFRITAVAIDEVLAANPNRKIELARQASGDGKGQWDGDRMAQVIHNLLSNALQYSPPTSAVRVELAGDEHTVTIIVRNEGVPIRADRLVTIFEPMKRATDDASNTIRSVGLGLYIVKHLVEAHRGSIAVQSDATSGTTFTVRVPRSPTRR